MRVALQCQARCGVSMVLMRPGWITMKAARSSAVSASAENGALGRERSISASVTLARSWPCAAASFKRTLARFLLFFDGAAHRTRQGNTSVTHAENVLGL